ncbi:hypothetical protein Vadar_012320 [Vaccinium darrowii]|uniref:Uncharacterized protein n=1 Tax=Vaccinium darrowii TaxID=229202 RepID=A0ACB7XZ94_9ERIC|nr:hypothetical protein Vadar_012320 [Vaccinium darrowii]
MSLEELRRALARGQLTVLHIHIPDILLLPKKGLKFENLKRFRVSVGSKFKYYEDFPGTRVLKHAGISLRNEFIPLVEKAEVLYLRGIKGLKKVLHDRGVRHGFLDLKYLKVTSCDDDLEYLLGEPKSSVQSPGQNPFQSFNKLTVLIIDNYKLKYLFSPTTARALVHLEQLEVISCEIMEGIVGFEGQNDINENVDEVKFSKLKQLELKNLLNLISFYAKKEKTQTTMGISSARPQPLFNEKVIFPVLERLDISKMGNIQESWDKQSIAVLEEQGSFCQLEDVSVANCSNLMHVFPSKMHPLLKNLKYLTVDKCETMKGVVEFEGEIDEDVLKNEVCFSKLIFLRLFDLPSLVSFCTKLGTVGTINSNATIHTQPLFNGKVAFPALEDLTIYNVPNITEIWDKKPLPESEKEIESFCKLGSINILDCNQLVYVLPSYLLPRLQNVQKLWISFCEEVEVIVSKDLKEKEATNNDILVFHQLKDVRLGNLPKLKSWYNGTQLFFSDKVAFPSLESLVIEGLPQIKEIWPHKQPLPEPGKEVESFCKLLSIHVEECDQLVYVLPSYLLPQLQHLENLTIGNCKDVEVIVSKELKEKKVIDNDIMFPQLKAVTLRWLSNLKRFCTETELFLSDKDAFPVLKKITLTSDLEFLRNGTSTEEECGTSGNEIDHSGEED